MSKKRSGLFCFNNDLRVHDNPALMRANLLLDELSCVYVSSANSRSASPYAMSSPGQAKKRFLQQSLTDLEQNLGAIGQRLIHLCEPPFDGLCELIDRLDITDIFRSDNVGWFENQIWRALQQKYPDKQFHSIATHTLFEVDDLPFSLADLPVSFSKFKNAIKESRPIKPIMALSYLPPQPSGAEERAIAPSGSACKEVSFSGGESAGLAHLANYFASHKPSHYKDVRNAIDGWDNSCKLSPWLANGCLSVREVYAALGNYEREVGANDSTYWIYFELLWREYFQWYANKHGKTIFAFSGIKGLGPLNSFYPERFQKWVNGSTPYPIVNACMNELNETGFLSNRGRQIVASCFINELSLDWRYGAAYFESVLIDYDVASNWGNWQYLAGVGADARDKRHFNLEKQTQQFDPEARYIDLWKGNRDLAPLDSVDAADWPI
ncbi:MAG: deoxyribodipyrimidine photo-lyase [Arenicella sp.]|jgi:deoxyribodipyrimidine photo-lyase